MDNVLEQQRKLHEERERLEDAVAKESLLKKGTVSTCICKIAESILITIYSLS